MNAACGGDQATFAKSWKLLKTKYANRKSRIRRRFPSPGMIFRPPKDFTGFIRETTTTDSSVERKNVNRIMNSHEFIVKLPPRHFGILFKCASRLVVGGCSTKIFFFREKLRWTRNSILLLIIFITALWKLKLRAIFSFLETVSFFLVTAF